MLDEFWDWIRVLSNPLYGRPDAAGLLCNGSLKRFVSAQYVYSYSGTLSSPQHLIHRVCPTYIFICNEDEMSVGSGTEFDLFDSFHKRVQSALSAADFH